MSLVGMCGFCFQDVRSILVSRKTEGGKLAAGEPSWGWSDILWTGESMGILILELPSKIENKHVSYCNRENDDQPTNRLKQVICGEPLIKLGCSLSCRSENVGWTLFLWEHMGRWCQTISRCLKIPPFEDWNLARSTDQRINCDWMNQSFHTSTDSTPFCSLNSSCPLIETRRRTPRQQ